MIKSLLIKNFILIDELFLEFTDGFNVLLGETGAGKSIIIKAIDTVLGAKTSKDILKDSSKHALIEITFEDNACELTISREISNTGTKCRLNGALVTLDEIKNKRENLVDIHTQFQTYTYMMQKYHIELLDSYITSKNKSYGELLEKHSLEFKRYIEVKKLLEHIKNESSSNKDRIEFLKFQIDEIEKADIKEKEEEELSRELEVLSNVQELKGLSYSAFWALGGEEGSVLEVLSKIGRDISKIKDFDPDMEETQESFFSALEILKDTSYTLRNYSDNLQDNPQRLDEISIRLELIEKLKRKYGNIFETYDKLQKELKELENKNLSHEELEKEQTLLETSLEKSSCEIDKIRRASSKELSDKIENELKQLEFDCPKFEIRVDSAPMNSKGKNSVEFYITTNISKGLSPLVKSASGGEISRIMLAIKTVFSNVDKLSAVIFDEIDTGISGKTSVSVSSKLFELSKHLQVFAITHQPIIASKSKSAFLVSKTQKNNNTEVKAKLLDYDGKIKAIAQMSSGTVDEKSLNFAKELILKGQTG